MRAKILSASAGSGKTYRLAYKFVHDTIKHYPEKPYLYRAILAATFTNKATEEMKSRILKEINDLVANPDQSGYRDALIKDLGLSEVEIHNRAKEIQSKILHDYSRFTVLTIDKFFQRILRAFVKELGLDSNYNLEIETSTILSRSTDALIDQMTADPALQQWLTEFSQENADLERHWDIRTVLLKLGGELFSEQNKQTITDSMPKEELRAIISRAEGRVAKAQAGIESAARQAMDIINDAGLTVTDFAGKSKSFAKIFADCADGNIVEPTKTHRQQAETVDGWYTKSSTEAAAIAAIKAVTPRLQPLLATICDTYDNNSCLFASLKLIKAKYRSYALLRDIYSKVIDICSEDNTLLLPETKYILSRFVTDNDAPFIYEKTGNRFERFMIDEFQDTSAKEWENFIPLLQNAMAQSEDCSVLIVGDVKQSIYRWRGGDWSILQKQVQHSLGSEDTQVEIMSKNYRSLPNIVKFNNKIIGGIVETDNEKLNDIIKQALDEGSLTHDAYTELHDTLKSAYAGYEQEPQCKSINGGYVRIEHFDEEPPIIECIESAIKRGYSYNDIMILYRGGTDGNKIMRILLDYKQRNNSFNITTQESLIVGKAAISNFIIAVLRLSQDNAEPISRAIMNDYIGRPFDAPLTDEDIELCAYISQLTPEQAFEQIVLHYGLDRRTDEIAYLQAVHEQIIGFCASKVSDIQLFLRAWDDGGAKKSLSVEKSDSTIELMTIHKAKGLEKKIVIIPYCTWSLDPIANRGDNIVWSEPNRDDEELAKIGRFPVSYESNMRKSIFSDEYYREKVYSHIDNINLLYVAATRAKEELYIYITKKKTSTTAGDLLWNVADKVISHDKNVESDDATKPTAPTPQRCEYGQLSSEPEPEQKAESKHNNILIRDYPTSNVRMALRLPTERYFEQRQPTSLSPRNIGILMHGILSDATDADDVMCRIEQARSSGRLSQTQAAEITQVIRREFERPQVKEWFAKWDDVRNENDIICRGTAGTRRPDRVMIQGDRVVIVDYKFGTNKLQAHERQVCEYMQLAKAMGYASVEGFVWYLTLGQITQVDPTLNI